MHGTWQVTGGGGGPGVRLVIAAVAAAMLLSWLATVLWLLALIGVVLLLVAAVLVLGLVRLLRRPAAEAEAFAARDSMHQVRARAAPGAVEAPPVTIHYHDGTHLHLEAGSDAAAVLREAGLLRADAPGCLPVDQ